MPDKKSTPQNPVFEIPADGSLGLLALGAVGLKAWRKKREEVKANKRNKSEEQGTGENKSSSENSSPDNQ